MSCKWTTWDEEHRRGLAQSARVACRAAKLKIIKTRAMEVRPWHKKICWRKPRKESSRGFSLGVYVADACLFFFFFFQNIHKIRILLKENRAEGKCKIIFSPSFDLMVFYIFLRHRLVKVVDQGIIIIRVFVKIVVMDTVFSSAPNRNLHEADKSL